uniref:Aminotransferase-like plant mobile domain-containing protein n=1 Tax=Setaria italica TaxID=4555 RepID=K3ZLS7_SETIT
GTCKCSQKLLVEIISMFNQEQKDAVEKAGFGSLLKLKDIEIRRELCKEIADSFDLDKEEFNIQEKKVKISIKDVDHILGLPSQGDEIKEPPKKHVPGLFDKYTWNDSTKIHSSELREYLSKNKTYGDDFIRIFVLYTIGFYLCPTLQPYVKSDYLGLVEEIDNIKNLNWSSLVLNFLIRSIREYKEVKAANLKGNLVLLQVWYWEKVSMSHMYPRLEHPGGDKPLVQYWDEKRAKERCKLARNHHFGEGKIVHDITRHKHNNTCSIPQCHTTSEQSDKGQDDSNHKIMQELQEFITNQYRLLSNQIDDRFNALNKRFDDVIQEQR